MMNILARNIHFKNNPLSIYVENDKYGRILYWEDEFTNFYEISYDNNQENRYKFIFFYSKYYSDPEVIKFINIIYK